MSMELINMLSVIRGKSHSCMLPHSQPQTGNFRLLVDSMLIFFLQSLQSRCFLKNYHLFWPAVLQLRYTVFTQAASCPHHSFYSHILLTPWRKYLHTNYQKMVVPITVYLLYFLSLFCKQVIVNGGRDCCGEEVERSKYPADTDCIPDWPCYEILWNIPFSRPHNDWKKEKNATSK